MKNKKNKKKNKRARVNPNVIEDLFVGKSGKELSKMPLFKSAYEKATRTLLCMIAEFGSDEILTPYDIFSLSKTMGIKTREFCIDKLRKLGFFVTDSKANFLFVKSDAISGEMLYEKLRKKGILVRHFNGERIKEYNRITIGTPEEMNAFLTAVKEILN